ncbi:hypothetical protein RJ55_06347 [Drechmeria coniospora]|nr:hypothetical protein RJ55_06347 [Drechmeria coniospora]
MEGLDKASHVRYWQRCHGNFLPTAYTANDSSRLTFAFFIVSALDLLSSGLAAEDRSSVRTWVLSLQHPNGGFCGGPSHALAAEDAPRGSANLAATFFALLLLAMAAEGEDEARAAFAGVERGKLLRWLARLQRDDGSFGQVLWAGEPLGGKDTRHSYLASCIRWMLRGDAGPHDVDVDAMVDHIRRGQTYDGGLAEASEHESHAGYAYCAVAALHMLDRPSSGSRHRSHLGPQSDAMGRGVSDRRRLVHFLVHRQFEYLAPQEEHDDDGGGENYIESALGRLDMTQGRHYVGYNGRWNKKADTCYCWWVAATLAMLGSLGLVSIPSSRRYILDITQNRIGGFSKSVGGLPDIYHSYLGLAALALMGDSELKEFDVGLCCSKETTRKVELARDGLMASSREGRDVANGDDGFWETMRATSQAS